MERNRYNKYDAGMAFCYGVITPQVFGCIFVLILMLIAKLSGNVYEELVKNNFVTILTLLISPLAFVYTFVTTNRKGKVNYKKAIGLSFKADALSVIFCIAISVICVLSINSFVNMFDGLISMLGFKGNYSMPLPLSNGYWLVLNLVLVAFIPAVVEELLFRGIIFNGLKSYGKYVAIFGSAILFALIHGGIEQLVYPMIVGTILALVVYKTGNLLYSIIIHFCNNAIVVVCNYYVLVNNIETGNVIFEFNFVNILTAILFAVCGICLILFIIRFVLKRKSQQKISLETIDKLGKENQIENTNGYVVPNKFLWVGVFVAVFLWIIDLIYGFMA